MSYARILIDRTEGTELDYAIPGALQNRVEVGARVRVPLRKSIVMGVVLSLQETVTFPKVKSILEVIDYRALHNDGEQESITMKMPEERPLLSPMIMKLAYWMADYYCTSLDAVLRSLVPTTIRNNSLAEKKVKMVSLLKIPSPKFLEALAVRAPRKKALLELILSSSSKMSATELLKQTQATRSSLHALVNEGWILLKEESVLRDPFSNEELLPHPIPKLNEDQNQAVALIHEELLRVATLEKKSESVISLPFLLHGVTGSGKTEVYLRAMEKALALGKTVLILVPEIALTPQTVERFRSRLEQTQEKKMIAVLHSHLSEGERHDEWLRLHRGEARIVIGARSAIFAPLRDLGLIIVDEEHETSYKQEETPRYHARDVAVMRARYEGAVLVLGSATPSVESMNNVHSRKYRLLELHKRADHQRMPLVRVIDMRLQGKQKGADAILSHLLRLAIAERLERSEQVILFLNRRGFSSSLLCPQCGAPCSCPNCSLSLTFHRAAQRLVCHLCGHREKPPAHCSSCHEPGILYLGVGTQRVEAAVQQAFPEARCFRMDADSMQRKGSYQEIFHRFRKKQIDILIGTQMIAKGLDFPNVTLVGIINADTSLHAPDFRAGERTFQLLTQVAGRAGRGDREGEVIVQTYTPESPSIQFARHHDYGGFFEQEIIFRRQFGYPPFQKMILIHLRGVSQEQVALHSAVLRKNLSLILPDSIKVGEAVPASLERAHGQYRFHIALHGPCSKAIKTMICKVILTYKLPSGVVITIDVDPQSLL
ncbi:MAG: primosomal protein N' [Chthoniobacterales bacterium]|nr:primosomal protein N' [Chthoniobacterales bacterium]